MNRLFPFAAAGLLALTFSGCRKPFLEVDVQQLLEKIYEPSAVRYETLAPTTVLYLDHSTCVIDARQNSPVFNALRPQLGQYSDTLRLIKGDVLETIPLNRSDNKVFQVLQTIREDIPFSDILKAVEKICHSNQQAILITDAEFLKGNLCHDQDPYLSEPLKHWLQKGHVVYVVTEPYRERNKGKLYDKKRFYFIFTDDRMQAPISHNMLGELNAHIGHNGVSVFKFTNSDLQVKSEGSNRVAEDLTFSCDSRNGFDYIEIDDDWDVIREYVMKLDKYGEPLEGEKPLPLVKNLTFNEGENYIIGDVEVVASDITAQYAAIADSLPDVPEAINISDGFLIDKDALQNHTLNVMLTDKIFNYLSYEYGGNLIRLDFVITQIGLKMSYDPEMLHLFAWPSLYTSGEAICVAKSIDNVLRDIEIVPTGKDRRVIHTVFLKTAAYK
ncbi:MAG: hypothetical protein LBC40_00255 [Dysgonamonadaceae bacterium]|jgi:hypothetical protein|nr:hypothetical protein [Dysgonamonadaceae bacterium]